MPWNNQRERIYNHTLSYVHIYQGFFICLNWFGVCMAVHSLLPFLSIIQIDIFINVWCLIHRSNHKWTWQGGKRMKEEEWNCICVRVCVYSETKKRSWCCWCCCAIVNSHIDTHIRPLSDSEFATIVVVFHMPISMMIMNGTHIVWQMIRVENPGVRYGWQKRRANKREKRKKRVW